MKRGTGAGPSELGSTAPSPSQTYRSEAWLSAVRSIERCVLCGRWGVCQPAHRNETKGKSLKTHDCWTAALCGECHWQIDQGKDMARSERRALLDRAIVLTLLELVRRGAVVPVWPP